MFPFDFLKWLIKDTWEDLKFLVKAIKKHANGEDVIDKEKLSQVKEAFKDFSIMQMIKDNWLWFLCIAFAGVCGWMLTAQYYQIQCNNFIIENYITPQIANISTFGYIKP
jgi:hypothetical protein